MITLVALLRGINVGGTHRLPMADLRAVLAEAGAQEVTTYIQSGNAVFGWPGRRTARLDAELGQAISGAAGFEVPVTLRSADELAAVVAGTPFPTDEPTRLHVSFLPAPPAAGAFRAVDREAFHPEDFAVVGREVYLFLPDGIGRTKLTGALGLTSRLPATTRNWRTVVTLAELARDHAGGSAT